MTICIVTVLLFLCVRSSQGWNEAGSVLLRDVQVLTLYRDRYTTARRSSPVPQLQCVGGSAGCHAFTPEVVQCQNRGWDGVDVQWECKTDMDSAYRFGRIEVSCEGFSNRDDPYVLKGSCGLEYTLELTEAGRRAGHQGSWSRSKGFGGLGDFASSFFSGFSGNKQHHHQYKQQSYPGHSEDSGSLLVIVVLLALAYGVYKLFLSGNTAQGEPGYPGDDHSSFRAGPPPPGFKPDFTGHSGANPGYGFNNFQGQYYPRGRAAGGTGGGFWTGMGAGGLMGYLFGRQRNQPYGYRSNSYYDYRDAPPPPPSSSGSRTASGFGGTKRR
ncbi:store-operated calcium entry-associated regulatory factor isoform X1 [Synchiropus splendidus]|uniref:store-operated calcium entry-associated regulatory factor isoform X1 n=1 Tax=Synchiropus splendidus TaxID=270530 RepID=UPI00237DB8CF|nr:store-operated calcium entry-associated regulatory factor isoform X1 [Synchiropus splendidus]